MLFTGLMFLSKNSYAQTGEDKSVKESALKSIENTRDSTAQTLNLRLDELKKRIAFIDSSLKENSSEKDKVNKLLERVKIIEDIQEAQTQNELNIYQSNYQSAIINLVSMEREFKPLILFRNTRDFYNYLTEIGNPTYYAGFNDWYKIFKQYIEDNKKKDARLSSADRLLKVTGDISAGTPLYGTFSQIMFTGIGAFIESLKGKKNIEMREKSQKMLDLTVILSQYTIDKNLVETEWETIDKELNELQSLYDNTLNKNLTYLGINKKEFDEHFTRENDADKRLAYLNNLVKLVAAKVEADKKINPKEWKDDFYYEMVTIQSLKVRFGNITFRISEHISKYELLVSKFKKDQEIGSNVATLDVKLKALKNAFDETFDPLEYINSATRMYKVN